MGILLFASVGYIILALFVPIPALLYTLGLPLYLLGSYILWVGDFFGQSAPITVPEPLILPLSLILASGIYFYGVVREDIHQKNLLLNTKNSI